MQQTGTLFTLRLALVLGLIAFHSSQMRANVVITSPAGGNNVSADKALNSTNGAAFTALGSIVITEGASTDFAVGNNQTLVLTIPDGWQFSPGVGTVTFTGARNITSATLSVTASTLTVTFSVGGSDKLDVLTIGGVQVQALDGANVPGAEYIRRRFENPGTALIAGIEDDFTTFGLLNQVAGAARGLAIQTQPGATANAGEIFAPQPQIKVVDQFGTLRDLDNTTLVTAARASGSGTLLGTLTRTAVFGIASYTNLSMSVAGTITIQFTASNLTSVTSASIVVNPAPADRLVFTTQPGSASAGVPFGIQPVLKTQDRFGSYSSAGLPASKLVTVTLSAGSGSLSGTKTLDIGTAAGNGTVTFTDLQIDAAGTGKQLTATSIGLSNAVSGAFAVSSAVFSKLQLLVPGETAAPGTATGKTGTPTPQAAGTPFNVTINAVDSSWNLVNTIADTVGLTSSDSNATLPANAALVSGTKTLSVTLNTVGAQALTTTDLTDGTKTPNSSPTITVGGGTPRKLAIQTQPSSAATAGTPFAQQPVIRVEDAGGNLVATDNGRVITVARGTGTAALQGTLTATTVNGIATFNNLSYNLAETITLNFTATGLTNVISGNVVVGTGPFSKLQLLVPGEAAAPGTASGKTGTASSQTVGGSFPVTVNAVDSQWNLLNTVTDTVGITSTDASANLPPDTALVAGTANLTVAFNATGNFSLTASDTADGTKTPNTSPVIAVAPAQFTAATGGAAISADGATGTFTSLTGPSYSENASGNVGTGTIILNAPAGFVFDTAGTAPTMRITRLAGTGKDILNINGVVSGTAAAMTSVSSTQLVFTVTSSSASGVRCSLTWQNVRVRPTFGTPLASGNLTRGGTASMTGVSPTSNLGLLREVPGTANKLAIQTQPSTIATAGVAFAQQPVLRLLDQFGNFCTNNSSTTVTASRSAGGGTLQGTTNQIAVAGLATFANLSHTVATNITVSFSAPGVNATNSSTIVVGAAAASQLVFITQPGSSTYGSALSPQPALKTQDAFGNDSTTGLGSSKIVSLAVSAGTGSLLGTTSLDIGTAAGNGTVSFSALALSMAGTGKQLSASATGLTTALSSSFDVAKATVSGSITANNKVYDGTTTATIATRALTGALSGDAVNLSGGAASFASKSAGTARAVTATGLTLNGVDAANYQLASTSATTTADITPRSLTVSATGVNKPYDGSTSATVSLADNRIAGDVLTSTYTSASFADKNIGTAKTVTVSGIAISGADAANYSANTSAITTANITAVTVTALVSVNHKIYDGTLNATIGSRTLNGVAGSDDVTLSGGTASFASKTVGTNKTVSVSGLSLSGTDAGNYQLASTSATTNANITARALSVTAAGNNKVYDGSTTATVALSDNRLAGDTLTATYTSATFASKNVGTAKTVSVSGIAISGADAANYTANTSATASADITARALNVTATGVNKLYDGATTATVTLADNRVAGDTLTASYTSASFASKNVGTARTINVSGITISGADALNYSANTTASATANITAAALTAVVTANNKVYDGTTAATLATNSLTGLLGTDDVTLSGGTASFASKTAGTNKTVSVSGLSLSGTDASNYQLASSTATTTANITARSLTVTASGNNKVYDGATTATVSLADNRLAGDTLTATYTTASFASKNVGTAKTVTVSGIAITGTDALNYSANTSASTTADITARSLTITAAASNKVYDGSTTATVSLSDNRLAGDSLTTSYTSATFATKSVGTAKTVSVSGIAISGVDALNYSANTSASATANITAKALTVSGLAANDKVYDGSTSATLDATGATLVGVINPDSVSLNSASATAAFADKNAGANKTVTVSALALTGVDAANYSLSQPTASASISKAGLTVTADDKSRPAGQPNPTLTASYSGFVGGETLATSGVTGSPALSATATNLAGTYPITAAQGTLSSANYSFTFVNGTLTVTAASASKLIVQTQPSSSATVGVAFATQPVLRIEDSYGNVRSSDNSTVVTAARNAGSGTLQGTLSVTASSGMATFANLSHNVAGTINLSFSSSGLTGALSDDIVVSPGAFAKLQLLVPGETAAPGTPTGKTGSASGQIVGASFPVTINAVDAQWNLVTSVSDSVSLSSSDLSATLPPAADLLAGSTNLNVSFNATGSFTLTATDLTDGSKTPGTSPAITVSPAQFSPATGGTAIAADGATGTFTTLTGPSYTENASGEVGTGTIILNAPAGFVFDTAGTAPTVLSVKTGGSGNNPVQGSITSVTTTQIVYTVTATSLNPSALTWQNIRVRPTAGTPLASSNLTRSGTASVVGFPNGANVGLLREVPGVVSMLVIQTQPSATAMAGVAFAQQPVIRLQDQFANFCTNNSSTVVTATRAAGSGILQGATSQTAVAGVVTFTNLSHNVMTNITIDFGATGATTATSTTIAISPGTMSRLVFATQPGDATAGSAFNTQPVVRTQDQFGNNTTAGLPASLNVSVSLFSGTGPLQGTTTLDIGASAGNGTVAFTNLRIDAAGTNDQLRANASGLSNALSSTFTVTAGPAANLVIQTQPPASAIAGATFSPAPVIRLEDAFGNRVIADNSTVVTATRNAGTAALQGTTSVTASAGLATFANLSYNSIETITIDFASSFGLVTSSPITVLSGVPRKLVIQTQPSSTATAGVAFAQQPIVYVTDAAGNLVNTNGLIITAARGSGTGTLQGALTASTIGGVATFTNLSYNVAESMTLNFTSGTLTNATSSNVVVGAAAFAKLQLLAPGETAAPGSISGKTGTPTARTAGTAFNSTVNAVDTFWNLTTNISDTVGLSSTDTNALLAADTALVNGTSLLSVTFKSAGTQSLTVSDVTDGSKASSTSPAMTVNPGAFAKLQILAPGESAVAGTTTGKSGSPIAQTAGTGFTVTVNAVDANWNLISTNDTVSIASSDINAGLPANAALSSGTRNFTVTNRTAGNWTFTASNVTHAGITSSTSSFIVVNAGAFAKLQLLTPGETAAPGSSTGKTGTPAAQIAGTPFNVTVNAVDANWNLISTVGDTVAITSSDANATLPSNTALIAGTQSLSVTLRTAGTRTLTASDITDGTKTASTSPSLTVNAGTFVKLQLLVPGETAAPGTATGKTGTPTAQSAGTAFNVTANAVDANWNLVNSVTHTVGITSSDSAATLPANAALVSGTKAFSLTLRTVGSQTATATDITDGTRSASTSAPISVNFGSANKLAIQTQPSSTATAGVMFAQQPIVYVTDAAGNLVNTNGLIITAARGSGTGTLQGTLSASTIGGVATFNDLFYNVAETMTVNFTSGTLTNATSSNVVVSAASFAKVQLLVPGETPAPGSASGKTGTPTARTAGTPFNVTVNAVDTFWNLTTNVSDTVRLSSTDTNALLAADTALVNGTSLLSVTFKSAGSRTLTAADVTDGTKTSSTSPAITVNAGAFAKLQILAPGESAVPGTTTGKSGSPTPQLAGTGFSVTVNAVDANWNLVSTAPTNTISITTTDPNDTHPANSTLASGTRNFTVTFKTAGSWAVTANNVTDATKTANTSSDITANSGAFTKLQILSPGETAAPGTATGKTGSPITQIAGSPFNITVNAVDANWNTVSTVADTVGITSSDANATLPSDTALVAGTQSLSVTLRTAGTRTLTASDLTDGTKTASTSPSITIAAGAFVKLQLLVPGETAAPGTATGKTGTPTTQGAGTAFNVTVRSVDADWNLVSSVHTVGITSTDTTATLPANGSLSAGTRTVSVTLRSIGSQTVTATDLTDGSKNPSTSPPISVTIGAANKLVIQTQPSSTATAGIVFAQQPVIYVTDSLGNLVTNDNGRVITAARSAGSGTLQGTVTATTVNGITTFTDLSHNVATNITINFTATGLTGATSGNIVVSPGTASQLLFSVQPGGTSRTGSPLATQPVVSSQDAFGNVSAVGLPASLNVSLALTSGSGTLLGATNVDIGTAAANGTAIFTDVECSEAGSNKQITASASGFTNDVSAPFLVGGIERATGGAAIPSSYAGSTYTNLTGPVYYEALTGDAGASGTTIILNAPSGFIFDTAGTAPTVRIDRVSGTGGDNKNINGVATGTSVAVTSRTTTQITFTIISGSSSGVECSLTWQDIRVRPSASSPLASGNITKTGTAVMAGVTASSTSFGRLNEVGPPSRLVIQTQPSSTGTAGVAFAQQPVIRLEDSAGNLVTTDNSTIVTAARSAGSGTLQGTLTARAANGVATFTNLFHNVATNITILFTSGSLTSTTSTAIAVSPAAAAQLVFTTQPGNGTIGSVLTTQPIVRSRDQFGNNSTVGLGANKNVTLSLSSGTGPLLGTTTLDIGTSAGNGVVAFTGLEIDSAGTNKQFTASASGLSNAVSTVFSVAKQDQTITFGSLANKTYGDPSFTLSATASSGLPVTFSIVSGPATISGSTLTITGAGTVTVRASQSGDATWNAAPSVNQSFSVAQKVLTGNIAANNKTYDGTTAASISSRTLTGVVGSDNVSLTGGTATFANKNAGIGKTVTATGLALSGTSAGNYQLASTSATTTADITVRTLTVSATAQNKAYDGSTSATATLSDNRVAGDTLTTSYTSASFANKNVGSAKTVTVSGISISGADSANYSANASATATADITARSLSVTATSANKVYDGTSSTTVTLSDNRLAGDILTTSYTSASFANKNVGTSKTVTVSGISISGADSANYTVNTSATATADITARALSVTASGVNKLYDGTTTASVTLSDNRVAGDIVNLTYTSATFADKNVGSAKTITVSGIAITGTDALNYSANTTSTATADITARSLTITATGANKVYDGTVTASVTLSDNRLAGDTLTTAYTSATFGDKNVGTAKTVTVSGISISGADAANYSANVSTTTTADITAHALNVTATGANKVYDGTVTASVTLSDSRLAGDILNLTYTSAAFADKNVGTAKTINVTGIAITGTDALNYSANTSATTTADITARALSVTATGADKVYDGTTTATVTLSDDRLVGDILNASYTTASFADKNVGTAKAITVSGIALTGVDAGNYTANTSASTTANITAKALTVSGVIANNKVYDGTTMATLNFGSATLVGAVAGDDVTANASSAAGAFANANVGTTKLVTVSGITLNGTDAGNYTLTQPTTTAEITPATITVTAENKSRTYGAPNPPLTASYSGFVNGENQSVLSGSPGLSTTADANSTVDGSPYPITVAAGTLSAANYTFSFVDGTLTITRAILTVTADQVTRAYGATNPVFTASYAGFLNADDTNVLSGVPELSTTADTNSPVGGSPYTISVTNGTLSATNYAFTFIAGPLTITQAVLTVKADDQIKQYGAPVPPLTASYLGFVNGENTNVLSGSPDLTTPVTAETPAGDYPITTALGSLSAANYSFAFQDGVFTVIAAPVEASPLTKTMAPGKTSIQAQPATLTGIRVVPNGLKITFSGIASSTYQIERASVLLNTGTVWTNIGSATTDANGQGEFTDTNPPAAAGFYRAVSP